MRWLLMGCGIEGHQGSEQHEAFCDVEGGLALKGGAGGGIGRGPHLPLVRRCSWGKGGLCIFFTCSLIQPMSGPKPNDSVAYC